MHLLFGGEVEAIKEIPHDEEGPHVSEVGAVKAQGGHQRQEQKVQALPELERHLLFRA